MSRRPKYGHTSLPGVAGIVAWAATAVLVLTGQAAADAELETILECPKTLDAGSFPDLDLHLVNKSCVALNARILSMVVGNGDESVGGLSILGPEVVAASVPVPAATDLLSGVCLDDTCVGSFSYCEIDADCVCLSVDPGLADVTVVMPGPVPAAFDGTVVSQIVITDKRDGSEMHADTCLLPEAGSGVQVFAVLSTLGLIHRVNRTRHTKEPLP